MNGDIFQERFVIKINRILTEHLNLICSFGSTIQMMYIIPTRIIYQSHDKGAKAYPQIHSGRRPVIDTDPHTVWVILHPTRRRL